MPFGLCDCASKKQKIDKINIDSSEKRHTHGISSTVMITMWQNIQTQFCFSSSFRNGTYKNAIAAAAMVAA